jgi:hypothetical protein
MSYIFFIGKVDPPSKPSSFQQGLMDTVSQSSTVHPKKYRLEFAKHYTILATPEWEGSGYYQTMTGIIIL